MDILALSYILLLVQSSAGLRLSGEPTCSNFVIEEQLLKKMVEVEIRSGVMMAEFKELAKTVKEEQQGKSTLVISKLKEPSETLRDIRTLTYQIFKMEENTNRTTKFYK